MMKIALYCRVSSEEQREHQSIETQVQALVSYAERSGHEVFSLYKDDGASGSLPMSERPEGKRLLKDAATGSFERVYVYMFDRFSRDVLEGLLDARTLKRFGVGIASLFEPLSLDDPYGHSAFVQSLNNAELWKKQFLFRVMDGQKRKARSGAWLGGATATYGYRVEGRRRETRIVLDDTPEPFFGIESTRADVARWMFEEIASRRHSCTSVAAFLNSIGVLSQRGCNWHAAKIASMVANPVFKGEHTYGSRYKSHLLETGCTADVPALVSPELWQDAQSAVSANRWSYRETNRFYLLRGLIRCAHCGSTYTGVTMPGYDKDSDKGVYYRCNWRSRAGSTPCFGANLSGKIEAVVWEDVESILLDPSATKKAMRDEESLTPARRASLLPAIVASLVRKKEERASTISQCRRGLISESDMLLQLAEIEAETKKLEADRITQESIDQIHAAQMARLRDAEATLDSMSDLYKNRVGDSTPDQKSKLIASVAESITIYTDPDKPKKDRIRVEIHYRYVKNATKTVSV